MKLNLSRLYSIYSVDKEILFQGNYQKCLYSLENYPKYSYIAL